MTRLQYVLSPFSPKELERGDRVSVFSPNGPWATFQGRCSFRRRTISTFNGNEVELGTGSNPEPQPLVLRGVIGDYETQGLKWSTTQESSVDLEEPDVVKMFAVADWATARFTTLITGQPTVIPPCSDIIMTFRPSFRYVVMYPMFHLSYYEDDLSGRTNEWMSDTQVQRSNSWRHRGGAWMAIFSQEYQINGRAEVLTGATNLETVAGVVDYYYERQPQCP
jgi:hypothetical protein